MLPPTPRCIFEMYHFTKSRWRTCPSIWIPASVLTHMTARRHSAPQPSVRKASKSPPSQNKQSILHKKHTSHIKHVQWKQSYQVRTIRASWDYNEWRIHFLTDQLFGSLRFNVSTGVDGDVKCYFICTYVCVCVCRGMWTIYLAAWDLKGMFIFRP